MRRGQVGWVLGGIAVALACVAPQEAPRVHLPIESDPENLEPVTSSEGYEITLTEARMVLSNFQFTTAGELHAKSPFQEGWSLLVPSARAHPGHYQGGEAVGQLDGRFVVDLLQRVPLGDGEFIASKYEAANFTFDLVTEEDLSKKDALVGHTALVRGTATKDDLTIQFTALLDAPENRQLVGAPFPFEITKETDSTVGFQFLLVDPFEGDTFFDGVDFESIDEDEDGQVEIDSSAPEGPAQDAYVILRRTLMTHDHYEFTFEP